MTATKKGFSSKETQKQLGWKRYEPIWAMVHKLRKTMGNRDTKYTTLEGMIEMDEGYFTVESSKTEQSKGVIFDRKLYRERQFKTKNVIKLNLLIS